MSGQGLFEVQFTIFIPQTAENLLFHIPQEYDLVYSCFTAYDSVICRYLRCHLENRS